MGTPARAAARRSAACVRGRARSAEARGRNGSRLTIRVGVLLPLHGPWSGTGERCRDAVEFARQLTEADHPAETPIEITFADVTTADEAEQEAARLIDDERVSVLLGTVVSPHALRASAVSASRGVPYFEVAAVGNELTRRSLSAVFRFGPNGSAYGAAVARFIVESLAPLWGKHSGEVSFGLLYNDNELGHSVAAGAIEGCRAAGVPVVYQRSVAADEAAEMLAQDIARRSIDVLYLVQILDRMGAVVRALRERRAPIRAVIGSAGWGYRRNAATAGRSVEGTFVAGAPSLGTFQLAGTTPGAQRDMRAWMARCGDAGPAHNLEVALDRDLFFSGSLTLFRGLATAPGPRDPVAVARLVRSLDLPLGSTPLGYGVSFGPDGENQRSFVAISQWLGGERMTVWPARLATRPPVLEATDPG